MTAAALSGSLQDLSAEELLAFLAGTRSHGVLALDGVAIMRMQDGMVAEGAWDTSVDAVFTVLAGHEASFTFHLTEPGGGEAAYELDGLLPEARSRMERWRDIAASIGSTDHVVRIARALPEGVGSVTITSDELVVLAEVDGRRTVTEICERLDASAFTVCEVLHRLIRSGCCTAGVRDQE